MHYVSTRATSASASRNPQEFSNILLAGLAPDGGLYLPAEYPQVTSAELDAWRKLSYADLGICASKLLTSTGSLIVLS